MARRRARWRANVAAESATLPEMGEGTSIGESIDRNWRFLLAFAGALIGENDLASGESADNLDFCVGGTEMRNQHGCREASS